MQKIDLNKHFSSGGIQEIEAHEGPLCQLFPALGALATFWFANFVTAYYTHFNNYIKYTFIFSISIYLMIIKNNCKTNSACIINSPHLVPKTPRHTIFKLNSMVCN